MLSRWPPERLALGLFGFAFLFVCSLPAGAGERVERGGFHFEFGPAPGWVEVADVAEHWPENAPGATGTGWRNWLIDAQIDRRNGRRWRYYDHAIEATSEALVANAARFEVEFNPDYQALHLHRVELRRAGQWQDRYTNARITLAQREDAFESDMSTGLVSALVVVADVRPGDVVRYAYSIDGENPVMGGLTHDTLSLAWTDPILVRNIRAEFDAGVEPAFRLIGSEQAPRIERHREGVGLRWRAERLAAIIVDSATPNWYSPYPLLEIGQQRDWSQVVAWARPLYPQQQPLPAELEARIADWALLPEPAAREAAALQAVQEEVRYFSVLLGDSSHRPAPPQQSWERRFGDCKDKAVLLSTVLARLGIEAVPALVSGARERGIDDGLPAATQFDHVIVRVELDGRTYWLDPTLSQQRGPLEQRQASDFGLALPVAEGVAALQDMAELRERRGEREVHERFLVQEDGKRIRLEITTRLIGGAARQRRQELAASSLEEISRGFADYYRRLHGELEVAEPLRIEDDERSGRLTMHEAYLLHQPWTSQSPSSRVFELYADLISPLLQLEGTLERRHPLWRPHPVLLEQVSELILPEGWSPGELPSVVRAADDSFNYAREVERSPEGLKVRQRFESRADVVPVAALARHFEQRRKAVAAAGTRLVLTPPAQEARSERSRRLRALLQADSGL
jgi:transglutaminase-like putative cysteine protease